MKALVFDVETTTLLKGHPFHANNRLCYLGYGFLDSYTGTAIDLGRKPYGPALRTFQTVLEDSDIIVGFNIKFDLHWIRRYGINTFRLGKPIWDCQLVEFILNGQASKFPSLDEVCLNRGLGQKVDVVKTEYWENGIDTPDIPEEIMLTYLEQDIHLTRTLFEMQLKDLQNNPQLKKLCWYACQDVLITQEMEWNGLRYDTEKSLAMGKEIERRIAQIDQELLELVPHSYINWSSGDHVSAVLYGGTVKYDEREEYTFVYKSGASKQKERTVVREINFPRLVDPLKNSQTAKAGFFKTDEGTLKTLKTSGESKKIVTLLLERRTLAKQLGTYFYGLPSLQEERGWTDGYLHGQLNHCVAATGRLASSTPNQQNLEELVRKCLISRF